MKHFKLIALVAAFIAFAGNSVAQVKIGYTNVEVILSYMPEAKAIESQLQLFQSKLSEQLNVKETYYQDKIKTYQQTVSKLTPEQKTALEKEIIALEDEIKKFAEEADYKLMAKREELLNPVVTKLQGAIDAVAKENGYTYILNGSNSSGVSMVLVGPESDDVTQKIAQKLGITITAPK